MTEGTLSLNDVVEELADDTEDLAAETHNVTVDAALTAAAEDGAITTLPQLIGSQTQIAVGRMRERAERRTKRQQKGGQRKH